MTNDILLLDGVKYIRYTPKNEDEFERMVVENAREIFGEEAIYLDIKKLIKNALGEGTIPDGFLFYPEQRRFVLVEVELSNHPVYEHISKQVNKFISAFSNYRARQKLATVLKEYIEEEPNLVKRMKPLLGSKGLYEFLEFEVFELLADNRNFEVIVIIEEETPTVCEALSWLKPTPQIIEVAIYARENAENVKAMRFVPTYIIEKIPTPQKELVSKKQGKILVEKSSNIVKELYDELKDWYLKEFESATFNLTGDYLGLAYQPSGLKRSYNICTVHSKCNWLRLHLRLEFDSIENPPAFAEKVDWFKWWKDGDTMARIRTESELTEAKRLIKLARYL